MSEGSAAGWHGKLPSLGDFATRRLDAGFVQVWDRWLAAGLGTLLRGPAGLAAYLASPVWRFVLMPGALAAGDATAWAGVLMPSVDRVGRYYPLTIAHPLHGLPSTVAALDPLLRWLAALDDLAADALHDDWTIAVLEAELARVGPPPSAAPGIAAADAAPMREAVAALPLGAGGEPGGLFAAQAAALWRTAMQGRAFWHAAGPGGPRLLMSDGLAAGLPAELFGMAADPSSQAQPR